MVNTEGVRMQGPATSDLDQTIGSQEFQGETGYFIRKGYPEPTHILERIYPDDLRLNPTDRIRKEFCAELGSDPRIGNRFEIIEGGAFMSQRHLGTVFRCRACILHPQDYQEIRRYLRAWEEWYLSNVHTMSPRTGFTAPMVKTRPAEATR